jgi:hypothetical protein
MFQKTEDLHFMLCTRRYYDKVYLKSRFVFWKRPVRISARKADIMSEVCCTQSLQSSTVEYLNYAKIFSFHNIFQFLIHQSSNQ